MNGTVFQMLSVQREYIQIIAVIVNRWRKELQRQGGTYTWNNITDIFPLLQLKFEEYNNMEKILLIIYSRGDENFQRVNFMHQVIFWSSAKK